LQFSVQAASPETFGYTFVCCLSRSGAECVFVTVLVKKLLRSRSGMWKAPTFYKISETRATLQKIKDWT